MHFIGPLLLAFKAWMLFDAMKRSSSARCGSSNYWFLICWIPFGDWVYFFAVKIHDPEFQKFFGKLSARPPKLDDIRYQANHTPSVANKLKLVRALIDYEEFTEAEDVLADLLRANPNDREVLFLSASCKSRSGNTAGAIETFEAMTEKDLSCFNYQAADALAGAYWSAGRKDDAVELLRRIFKKSQRLTHQVELANCLSHLDRRDEAKEVLKSGINDYKHSPRFVKRQYRADAKKAESLLRSIS